MVAVVAVAGLLVVLSHVPLGQEVVRRGIIFIDLAIAQIAGVGIIAAGLLGLHSPWAVQLFAACSALAGALLLTLTERHLGNRQEPLIGVLFVLAASLGLLLLAGDPHGSESLKTMLSGQILWVGEMHLLVSGSILLGAALIWWLLQQKLQGRGFYFVFAIAITASVQLVGVYLVFASLVIPALATVNVRRRRTLLALLLGWVGYGAGLLASLYSDLPAAPLIVCCLAGAAGLVVLTRKVASHG